MSRDDLLELASLDALGLLDEYEADLYTRAFHHAPAPLQDELRELQAAVASDARLLPDVKPRPELRDRTLSAMSAAAEAASAPIASIGAKSTDAGRVLRPAAGAESLSVRRVWQSAVLWRAACFVLMGAVVVLSYFSLLVHQRNNDLVDLAMGLGAQEELRERMGDEAYAKIFLPTNDKVALRGIGDHDDLAGVVIVHEASHEAYLIVFGQIEHAARLQMADGTTHDFTTASEIAAVSLGHLSDAVFASLATASFAVIDTVTNETLMLQV